MKTDQLALSPKSYAKLEKAKEYCQDFFKNEDIFLAASKAMMWNAYKIGKILVGLKQEIGHGKWMIWITSNFRELGKDDDRIIFNAQRCMNLAKDNPNSQNSENLSIESVRKFMYGYIPVKLRPQLEGDGRDSPVVHPLTCRNYWEKWDRQQRTGQIPPLSIELLWHDLGPMFLRMAEVLGIQRCINELEQHALKIAD